MTLPVAGREIVISEAEFARVVALKAERDALDMDAQMARAELEKASLDLIELTNRQREATESSNLLGQELELAQQAISESEKNLTQAHSAKLLLERQAVALEDQISSLKDQIVLRDSQIAKRDVQIEALSSELNAAQLDVLQYQVERSKTQVALQSCHDFQQTITRLEDELKLKEQHQILNEKRLGEMQKALSDLEALFAGRPGPIPTVGELLPKTVNVTTYNAAPFLEACSKAELLARIDLLRRQNHNGLRRLYLKGFIVSTIALVLITFVPVDEADTISWLLSYQTPSWIPMLFAKLESWLGSILT